MKYLLGDGIIKDSGDYTFTGEVVARFKKRSGLIRYVAEDDRGLLFIFPETTIKLTHRPDANKLPPESRALQAFVTTLSTITVMSREQAAELVHRPGIRDALFAACRAYEN